MSIEGELIQFITSEVLIDAQKPDLTVDEPLISSGRVDSMGLLTILGFIQQRYGVDLMSVGGPEDFDSVNALVAAVRRSRGDERGFA